MLGTTLGHYRIIDLLGKGGMGEVYLAEDLTLQRPVALKVLARELASDPDRRQRFEREARAVASLNHPNIVTIHSVEQADGELFLTLERVEGQTLTSHIPADGLPLDRLLNCAIPLTDAVGVAHQRGITHRDLKPANVMLTSDGRVKVLDFGLAKLKEEALAAQATLPTAELTGEGRIVGTAAYMSPEQAEGKPVDPRSDVFSLGVMLYEMATGVRPFKGDTQVSLLSSIIKDTPSSITDLKHDLPRELARIVKHCLAKDPEDRYQTAKDLRNDLRSLKQDLDSGELSVSVQSAARPLVTKSHRGPLIAILAAVGLLAVGATAAYMWRSRTADSGSGSAGQRFQSVALTRLTTTGTAGLAAISDDGRYVAYVVTQDGKAGLWLRQVATSSNVQIVPAMDGRFNGVSFSPDGNHVYYSVYPSNQNVAALYQVPVLGGGSRKIIDDVDGVISFAPDGNRFTFARGMSPTRQSAVMIADLQSGDIRELSKRLLPAFFLLRSVSWSPDGRTVAVAGGQTGQLRSQVLLLDVESGQERVLGTHAWRFVSFVAWLPDGNGLLVNAQEATGEASSQIWLMTYPEGAARRLTNDLSTYNGLSVSRDGRTFVTVRNELRTRIWTVPQADSNRAQTITAGAGTDDGVTGLAWMPDGRILYAGTSGGNSDIWRMNADGTNRVQLSNEPGHETWPRISADGRVMIFAAERDGLRRLWRMDSDGGGRKQLGEHASNPRPSLSADGKWVYYTDSASSRNFKISVDGGAPVPLFSEADQKALPPNVHEPLLSPDGQTIAAHYAGTDSSEHIVLIPASGGAARLLPSVPIPVQWSQDSRSLIYPVTRAGLSNLWRQAIAGGPPTQMTQFTSEQIYSYGLSHDQKTWAVVRGETSADVVLVSDKK